MRRLGGILGTALAVLATACGGGSGVLADLNPFEVVDASAASTLEVDTARTEVTLERGDGLIVHGKGLVDFEHGTESGSVEGPGSGTIDLVDTPDHSYLRVPKDLLPFELDTPWFGIDRARVNRAQAGIADVQGLNAGGPTDLLAALRGASKGAVKDLGTERVRGTATRHYHALLDLERALRLGSTVEDEDRFRAFVARNGDTELAVDVWIDADRRVRKFSYRQPAEDGVMVRVTEELYDFGTSATPTVPAASDVTDLTAQALLAS